MARAIPGVRDLVARSSVEPVTTQGVVSVAIRQRQLFIRTHEFMPAKGRALVDHAANSLQRGFTVADQ
jgi:hypothetical protein